MTTTGNPARTPSRVPGQQRPADRPVPWESGLVIVDKPGGMTSHDVVARIRRLAHTRRVGHAGTLDPMATGVLVIGVEKATRLLGHLMLTEKTYQATIRLGQSTTTDDAEGEPAGGSPATGITRATLDQQIVKLTGEILQIPSSVSAIKVNGQRAYKLTRAGEAPELAARPVTIHEFRVTAIRHEGDFLDVDATIRCSSGTYIRALARDLGDFLATGGHLTALRRTAVGPYTLARAHPLEALENQDPSERLLVSPVAHPAAAAGGISQDRPVRPAPDDHATSRSADRGDMPPWHEAGRPPSPHPTPGTGGPGSAAGSPAAPCPGDSFAAGEPPGAPWVTPLAEAAAEAFPRLDLTEDEARRLARGARLSLPPAWRRGPQRSNRSGAVPPGDEPAGAVGPSAAEDQAQGATAPEPPGAALAAFAPDGTLVALVTAERGQFRSLAVFADPAPSSRGTEESAVPATSSPEEEDDKRG